MKPVFTLKILTPLALIFFLLILKQSPTYALAGKSFNAQSHTPAQSVGSGNHHRASGSVLATQRRHQRTAQDHQRVATYIRSSANLTDQRRGLYPQGIENPGYISDTETGAPPDPHRHLKPTKPPANRAPVPAPRKSKHGHDGESPVAPTPAPRLSKAGNEEWTRKSTSTAKKTSTPITIKKISFKRRGSRRRSPSRVYKNLGKEPIYVLLQHPGQPQQRIHRPLRPVHGQGRAPLGRPRVSRSF
ncbi:hypothetical protein MTO96_006375 [Rhipicephalus appendiculatus]